MRPKVTEAGIKTGKFMLEEKDTELSGEEMHAGLGH